MARIGRVPVEVFDGSLNQAMRAAAEANTKDKLPMSRSEKSNTAWHLVTMADMTKVEVSKASSVSESTVATMRKVFIQLESKENDETDDLMAPTRGNFRDLMKPMKKRRKKWHSLCEKVLEQKVPSTQKCLPEP
jgi:hypothetical protein